MKYLFIFECCFGILVLTPYFLQAQQLGLNKQEAIIMDRGILNRMPRGGVEYWKYLGRRGLSRNSGRWVPWWSSLGGDTVVQFITDWLYLGAWGRTPPNSYANQASYLIIEEDSDAQLNLPYPLVSEIAHISTCKSGWACSQ